MFLKNTYARIAYTSSLFLLLVSCASNSTPPEVTVNDTTPSTGTATCVADGSGWKCDSDETATSVSQPQRTAQVPARAETQERRKNVPWWSIRLRNNSRDQGIEVAESQPEPIAPIQRSINTQPAPVVASSVGQPTVSQPTSPTVQTAPAPVYQTAPVAQTANTWSQPVSQPTTKTYTLTPQPSEPAQVYVTGDGLGRDFDYAVQLAAFSDYAHSSDFLSEFPTLELQRIKTISNGRTFYIVIAGTYETKQLAEAQSQMLRTSYGLGDPYIRTVRSIRTAQSE